MAYVIRVASGSLQVSSNLEALASVKGTLSFARKALSCGVAPEAASWKFFGEGSGTEVRKHKLRLEFRLRVW